MFTLHTKTPERECAAVVDIGSGSVGVALVVSDISKDTPEIIWSKREHVILGDALVPDITMKNIHTTLMNAMLAVGNTGLKELQRYDDSLSVTSMQVCISAPWSYTVTKTVHFSDAHPFEVTEELIAELTATAQKKVQQTIAQNGLLKNHKLELLDDRTIRLIINGYPVQQFVHARTRKLTLAHLTAVTQKSTIDMVKDAQQKILPQTKLQTHSFMYMYYQTLETLHTDLNEACLVDITTEATEVGIVREGILTYVSHIPFGSYTLAREIADAIDIPKEEAFAYLKTGNAQTYAQLSKTKQDAITIVLAAYEERLAKILRNTSDILTIPKTIFIHTDLRTEEFFAEHIKNAAHLATEGTHTTHMVTGTFLNAQSTDDTAIYLSALHFHHQRIHTDYS